MADKKYTELNASIIDGWTRKGWIWGKPITHEQFLQAQKNNWSVLLTPTKPVPKEWFGNLSGASVLGLASDGGQQMPLFTACGANCTVMDLSDEMLKRERDISELEGYSINIIKADMTKPFPFESETFDLIFNPVSNCYVQELLPIWKECYRVLKKGGILLSGVDNGIAYAFDDDDEPHLKYRLPFDPLENREYYDLSIKNNWGIQFSHTMEDEIGDQIKAGFTLTDIYQDTIDEGPFAKYNVPLFYSMRSVKKE
jgi:SAM-dependent methyltransferase